MKLTVRYFALLRERLGRESEVVPGTARRRRRPAARAPRGRAPAARGGLLRSGSLLVAVNREYAAPETPLRDGDEVAFLPPVTGG